LPSKKAIPSDSRSLLRLRRSGRHRATGPRQRGRHGGGACPRELSEHQSLFGTGRAGARECDDGRGDGTATRGVSRKALARANCAPGCHRQELARAHPRSEHDFAHPVEPDSAWSESYYFNAYDPGSDSGFFTRIGVRPNEAPWMSASPRGSRAGSWRIPPRGDAARDGGAAARGRRRALRAARPDEELAHRGRRRSAARACRRGANPPTPSTWLSTFASTPSHRR